MVLWQCPVLFNVLVELERIKSHCLKRCIRLSYARLGLLLEEANNGTITWDLHGHVCGNAPSETNHHTELSAMHVP